MEGKKNALYRGLLLLAAMLLLAPALSVGGQVKAESAAQSVSVIIPETLRININQSALTFSERRQGEADVLYPAADQQKVQVKVLSNSPQTWLLRVNASMVQGQLEWSADGAHWNKLGDSEEVLTGQITGGWKEYSVYYRLRQTGERSEAVQLDLTYDLTTMK